MTLTQIKPAGLSKPVDLADNEKIRLGTGNDLEIYHDGNDSWIKDPGTRHFNFTAGQYQFLNVGANEFLIKAVADGAVELYHNGSKKFETLSGGGQLTGSLDITNELNFTNNGNKVIDFATLYGSNTVTLRHQDGSTFETAATFTANGGAALTHNGTTKFATTSTGAKITGQLNFDDGSSTANTNGIGFGSSQDCRLFHSGSSFQIRNVTGPVTCITPSHFQISADSSNDTMFKAIQDGAVELYYDNAKKFETSSSGATLQGTLTAQGTGYGSGSSNLEIQPYGQRGYINWTGTENFYFRTGSSYATRWIIDGSGHFKPGTDNTYNLGSTGLRWQNIYGDSVHLPDSGTVHFGTADTAYVRGKDSSDGFIRLGTNGLDRLEINSSGSMRVPSGYIGNSLSDNFTFHGKTQPHYGFNLSASNGNPSGISGYYGLAFATNSLERMRIRQQGGVTFNGDTADANALDDYEEGTATPDFPNADNSIVTVNHYHYTKVGRLVHFEAKFTVGSNNDGSGFGFSLPFGQAGSRETVISAISTRSGTTTTPFAFVVNASQSYAYAKALDGYGHGNVEYTDFAGDVILVSGTYEAA